MKELTVKFQLDDDMFAELEELLGSEKKIKAVICKELDAVSSKYFMSGKIKMESIRSRIFRWKRHLMP